MSSTTNVDFVDRHFKEMEVENR